MSKPSLRCATADTKFLGSSFLSAIGFSRLLRARRLRRGRRAGPASQHAQPSFRRLEARRVLNASFAFDGVDGLLLSNFDSLGGTSELDISFDSGENDLLFTLNRGMWIGSEALPDISVADNLLRVDRSLFEGMDAALDLRILDDNASGDDIALNVIISQDLELPNSPINGSFEIRVDGFIRVDASLQTFGSDLVFSAHGLGNAANAGNAISAAGVISTTEFGDAGGDSGGVQISATGDGDILLAGISTRGADGPNGGDAGSVHISTFQGEISVGPVDASGGDATEAGGWGGSAGIITLSAKMLMAPRHTTYT